MKFFLLSINIILNTCLLFASGILQIPDLSTYQIIAVVFSGVLLITNVLLLKLSGKSFYVLGIILAVLLIIVGFMTEQGITWQVVISSSLILLILLVTLRLRSVSKNFILHAADGAVLMEVKKIEYKDSKLVVRGKMMGTMPTTAHMHPDEIWKALTMMSLNVILRFPRLIYLGWKASKANE